MERTSIFTTSPHMSPTITKQWKVTRTDKGFDGLEFEETSIPSLGENEVLVKIHAASLNYRDLMIPRGDYPFPLSLPIVPCSDGAGEIMDTGSKVTLWRRGDKVITTLNQAHLYGPFTPAAAQSGLGGSLDGTLRQYGVFNEQGLVRMPQNLSFAEASTLSCAGVTSWNALYGLKPVRPGQTVLVLGTGGVSVFALQFAKAAGANVIATTSSDEKVATLRKLGADHVVNYKTDAAWGETVKGLSPGGNGVDHIIEVGGAGTLHQSFKAIKNEGVISVIGAVSEGASTPVPTILDCWLSNCTARGVAVGSREMMEEMVSAVESNDIHPFVDERVFKLEEAKDAYHYLVRVSAVGAVLAINVLSSLQANRKNLGKVIISMA